MSREILFKAKRIDNGEWITGYYFKANLHWHNHGIHEDWLITNAIQNGGWCNVCSKYAIDRKTLCQYTGLTDKNGDKIWENDVVKVDIHESNLVTTQIGATYSTNIVECERSSSYMIKYCPSDLMNLERWTNRTYITCEVIGNIFDNPELVNGSEDGGEDD